jgi:hypothetical protein
LNKNQFQNITYEDPLFDFDILLGAIRNHRNFVMAKLQNSFLLSKSIVTYRSAFSFNYSLSLTGSDSLTKQTVKLLQGRPLLHPYVSSNLDPSWEVRENITNDVSELVPWEIYRHTKYSVVCETNPYNTFITEKIGKVLFAKRIFVLFGSYKYLDTLRKLGFRTFHGIIDETYDTEHSPVMRYNMAFEQLEWLSKQDHKTIIDSTAEICNHNHNHLLKYHQEIKHLMSKAVYNKIQEIKNAKNIQ